MYLNSPLARRGRHRIRITACSSFPLVCTFNTLGLSIAQHPRLWYRHPQCLRHQHATPFLAKKASDIILMDNNFSSIVHGIMWGHCVKDAVRKLLQFQININIAAVVITFVTALAAASGELALSAVQLLWTNLIINTFAALTYLISGILIFHFLGSKVLSC